MQQISIYKNVLKMYKHNCTIFPYISIIFPHKLRTHLRLPPMNHRKKDHFSFYFFPGKMENQLQLKPFTSEWRKKLGLSFHKWGYDLQLVFRATTTRVLPQQLPSDVGPSRRRICVSPPKRTARAAVKPNPAAPSVWVPNQVRNRRNPL